MKTSIFILLSCLILSCSGTDNSEPVDFNGNWVSTDYLESLEDSHSPKITLLENPMYVTEMVISKDNGDSVVVYNGQKERAAIPFTRAGDSLKIKLNLSPETALTFRKTDSTLVFTDHDLNRIYKFRKAADTDLDASYEMPIAFPALVNKKTFSGIWDFYQNNEEKIAVEFTDKGQIKGLDKFNEYSVIVNGDLAINKDGDAVIFSSEGNSELVGFSAAKDEINLYHLKPLNDSTYSNYSVFGKLVRAK